MLKDPECAARYEESMRAVENDTTAVNAEPVVMFNVSLPLSAPAPVLGYVAPEPTMADKKVFQEALAQLPQVELTPVHHFAEHVYGRELFIPAGTVVVGKIHRHEHLVMLMKGDVTINTGEGMERIVGPKVWVSQPGIKRVLYTHTDCTFFTVHPSDKRDLAELEADIIEPEPSPALYCQKVMEDL